jgi:hypothetical protein
MDNRTSPAHNREYANFVYSMKPVLETLAAVFGVDAADVPSWSQLHDVMVAFQAHGHPLPAGLTAELQANITAAAEWVLDFTFSYPEIGQLSAGLLVHDITNSMLFFAQPSKYVSSDSVQPARYMMWSGHDSTIGPLTIALGIWDGAWPAYASHVIVELWQYTSTSAEWRVVVSYQDKTVWQGSLEEWMSFVAPVAMDRDSWNHKCHMTTGSERRWLGDSHELSHLL